MKEEDSNDITYEIDTPVTMDRHKRERRIIPTTSIGGFVDLSTSPCNETKRAVICSESIEVTTELMPSNGGRRRKISESTTMKTNKSLKILRKASDIECKNKQEDFQDFECNQIKYVDMRGSF